MSELFFFSNDIVRNLPNKELSKLTPILHNLLIPESRPFILRGDGMIDEDLDKFFDYLASPSRRSPNTWKAYASQIIVFIRFMEAQGKHWKKATKEDLNRYYMVRTTGDFQNTKPIKGTSWNLVAAALVHLYEFSKYSGLISEVPFNYRKSKASLYRRATVNAGIPDLRTKDSSEIINFISIDNYKNKWRPELIKGQNSQRNLALTDLLISSGLRISEALALKVHNISDPDCQAYVGRKTITIKITGKGGKSRNVRIPKRIIRAIRFYIDEERELIIQQCKEKKIKVSENVFIARSGNNLSARSVQSIFQEKSKITKIKLTPHGCRHTFAVYQLEAMIKRMAINLIELKKGGSNSYHQLLNDPLRELQKLLGHAGINTTYIYLNFLEDSEALVDESFADWTNWEQNSGQ